MTTSRVAELCRRLKPLLGRKIDKLYTLWLTESSTSGRAEIEQTLELLGSRHLGNGFEPDTNPFPPPPRAFSTGGQIEIGDVAYAGKSLFPFRLNGEKLNRHALVCGQSGSGKTNMTFVLARALMDQGIKVLALDWKRGYRDLLQMQPDLKVYTIGRNVSPFRFNPLIPPPGCEPGLWVKLIVDVIASAYFGGEGVISLLVTGLDYLYREAAGPDGTIVRWPTVSELLAWLRKTKLVGRAAMWKASAERILLAMTYGEFADVLHADDNHHLREILDKNVILEMDGLSSNADRTLFAESLTLYLYRQRLAEGPREKLTNVIVLEEAHHLLLAKQAGARESVLETSIRMVRQYGMGYVFVDQSASMLSKVAFANSYMTIALNQKLSSDVRTMASAMNLDDEQKQSLSTLPVGTAVVRLSDEWPRPFLIQVPRCPVKEGAVTDDQIRQLMTKSNHSVSTAIASSSLMNEVVTPIPRTDKSNSTTEENHRDTTPASNPPKHIPRPPPLSDQSEEGPTLTRETIRFMADVVSHPLSTTVNRYQRLHLSRRKGNAVRQLLIETGWIEPVKLPTRAGQVVLVELTGEGRAICQRVDIDPGAHRHPSLEHLYWVHRAAEHFNREGYVTALEQPIGENKRVDILAQRDGQSLAIEVETGKSNITENLKKLIDAQVDRICMFATNPTASARCRKIIDAALKNDAQDYSGRIDLMTWIDID